MRWLIIAALLCAAIAPFDALYMYIRADRRRQELKRREREKHPPAPEKTDGKDEPGDGSDPPG